MILGKGEVEPAGQLVSQLSDKYPEAARSDADVRQAIAYVCLQIAFCSDAFIFSHTQNALFYSMTFQKYSMSWRERLRMSLLKMLKMQ